MQQLKSSLGICDENGIRGWVIDTHNPNERLEVEIFIDGELIVKTLANIFRQDLLDNGIGDGYCAFHVAIPNKFFDGIEHSVAVKEVTTKILLTGSPKTFTLKNLRGLVDFCDENGIGGWAIDMTKPHLPVELEIFIDDNLVFHITANLFRQDLFDAKLGKGNCAFNVSIPDKFLDGVEHSVSIQEAVTKTGLQGSPKTFTLSPKPEQQNSHLSVAAPATPTPKIAVVVHVYYLEIWTEIAQLLKAITYPFDLFVTTTTEQAGTVVPAVTADFPKIRLHIQPNNGMDVLPFLALIPLFVTAGYLAVCKLHTKRGDGGEDGASWRRALLHPLIGDDATFTEVVQAFVQHADLQLVGPASLYLSARKLMLNNEANVKFLFQLVENCPLPVEDWGFFAGSMLWLRPTAVQKLAQTVAYLSDQHSSEYQPDGQVSHAIERLLGLVPVLNQGQVGLLHSAVGSSAKRYVLQIVAAHTQINQAELSDILRQSVSSALLNQSSALNILFVLYQNIHSNGGLHVQLHAARLIEQGADCCVAVPDRYWIGPETASAATAPLVDLTHVVPFSKLLEPDVCFPFADGRGPDIIHAWTPREIVRKFVERFRQRVACPLIVHLEDNEEYLTAVTVGRSFAELVQLSVAELDALIPIHCYHPHRGRAFLDQAQGLTLIIETLERFNTNKVPTVVLPPPVDERLFYPRPLNLSLRRELGIPDDHTVLAYTGNVHEANRAEVSELYRAVELLNQQGCPTVLLRTGMGGIEISKQHYIKDLGWVERERVPEILAAADILVQPGVAGAFNDERVPSKLLEYLAMGRPVVLPRINFWLKVTPKQNSYVIDVADATSLVKAVQTIKVGLTSSQLLFFYKNYVTIDINEERLATYTPVIHSFQKNRNIVAYPYGWQRPNKTEEWVYECCIKNFPDNQYIQLVFFPWATLIDLQVKCIEQKVKPYLDILNTIPPCTTLIRATVCQHIYAKKFFSWFKQLKITDLFWSHATRQESVIDGIRIHPFPLYPIRCAEYPKFVLSEGKSLLERKYLYSFIGAYDPNLYISPVRQWIFDLPKRMDAYVKSREEWHYQKIIFEEQFAGLKMTSTDLDLHHHNSHQYAEILQETIFSLCPSGSGPNSIRLWESLGFGCIPVILSDTLKLPGEESDWQDAAIRIKESEQSIQSIPDLLEQLSKNRPRLQRMRDACRKLWNRYGLDSLPIEIDNLLKLIPEYKHKS